MDEGGTPIRPEWYSDEWVRLCHTAGIARRVKLHEARHYSVVTMRRTYDHADLDTEGLAEVGATLALLRAVASG